MIHSAPAVPIVPYDRGPSGRSAHDPQNGVPFITLEEETGPTTRLTSAVADRVQVPQTTWRRVGGFRHLAAVASRKVSATALLPCRRRQLQFDHPKHVRCTGGQVSKQTTLHRFQTTRDGVDHAQSA